MEENKAHQEDEKETIKMNIKQFIEATRRYLFPMAPSQPVLATIPVRNVR
jgi:Trm5-related predicted tRNA methylase